MKKRYAFLIILLTLTLTILISGCSVGEAFRTKTPLAYDKDKCYDSDKGINLEEKGTTQGEYSFSFAVKTDYCNKVGKLIEYYCSRNKVQTITKNCKEIGINSVCEGGRCVFPIPPPPCNNTQLSFCCGNGIWEPQIESPITCPTDANTYFNSVGKPIEKIKGDDKIALICLEPCPFTENILTNYLLKYKLLVYDKIADYVIHFPPAYKDDYIKYFYKNKYPSLTLILGESNTFNFSEGYVLLPSAGGGNQILLGCPTGLCSNNEKGYFYINDENKIFKQLDYLGNVVSNQDAPNKEMHETLHNFIPDTYCPDWNHGLIMFLDNILTNKKLIYEQYLEKMSYIYENKVSINNLTVEQINQLKADSGTEYSQPVGYIFFSGLYTYYGCEESDISSALSEWIEQINKDHEICYGNELINLLQNHCSKNITDWVKLMGLESKEGLVVFKSQMLENS